MTQLYAKIKRSCRYYSQNQTAKSKPERWGGYPFKVTIDPQRRHGPKAEVDDYCVQGGPGGQYRLAHVNLYIKRADGVAIRIS